MPQPPHPDRGLPDLRRPRWPRPRGDRSRISGIVRHDYLRYRIRSTAYLGEALQRQNVPVVQPIGGHAVYLDARAPSATHRPARLPGQALAVALYETGGIRGCEIGTVMFGRHPDGTEAPAAMDLVRLAIPRRTYTQSHIDYVIEVCASVAAIGEQLPRLPDHRRAADAASLHRPIRADQLSVPSPGGNCPTWLQTASHSRSMTYIPRVGHQDHGRGCGRLNCRVALLDRRADQRGVTEPLCSSEVGRGEKRAWKKRRSGGS